MLSFLQAIGPTSYALSRQQTAGELHISGSVETSAIHRFDVILTSETIYEVQNYPLLLAMFEELLTETGTM